MFLNRLEPSGECSNVKQQIHPRVQLPTNWVSITVEYTTTSWSICSTVPKLRVNVVKKVNLLIDACFRERFCEWFAALL